MKTDRMIPFFGVVENVEDPEEIGRVQVRAYGFHTDNKAFIPSTGLPWFSTVVPNSTGSSGVGESPTGYETGATVFGFFISQELQEGVVLGSVTGTPIEYAIRNKGFNDPSGEFPRYITESDVNRLARGDKNHWLFDIRDKSTIKGIQTGLAQPQYNEPDYNNQSSYPNNRVLETRSGHLREIDDTEGQERIHEYHRTGTYYEITADGTRVVKVVGDGYEIIAGDKNISIRGDANLTVDGNLNTYVKGNSFTQIDGNKKEVVLGSVEEFYNKHDEYAAKGFSVDASTIDLNSGKSTYLASTKVTLPVEYAVEFALPVIAIAGRFASFDEPEVIGSTPTNYPADVTPESDDGVIKDESVPDQNPIDVLDTVCPIFDELDYSLQLTNSFNLADVSNGTIFPHNIQEQGGRTESEIVCNLKSLLINIGEPLNNKYAGFTINSGFRKGSGRSQHERGMAMDIQWYGISYQEYFNRAKWIAENLNFDQLIFEHGRSIWIHISFNRESETQRGNILTMKDGNYENGLKLYY